MSKSVEQVHILAEGLRRVRPGEVDGRLLSIVLPVKNAGAELRELLPRIVTQRCNHDIEIIAVDSGSVDDTVEVLRTFNATVLSVDPQSFNYGLTRNLAARHAAGEFLVFTTSRALPAHDSWLANLIAPLVADDRVAGVFSRSFPRAEADFLTRRDDLHWTSMVEQFPHTREIRDWNDYRGLSASDRFNFVIFSNVSAGIRSSIFSQFPFPETIHGEDMLWARLVLEAGYKVHYEPSSAVLRSHRYSYPELFRRNFDAGVAAQESVGLQLDVTESISRVMETVLSDWFFLEHGCRLSGDEYDRWRAQAVLHRAAQHLGFCLGANTDVFQGDIRGLVATVEREAISPQVQTYAALFGRLLDAVPVLGHAADEPEETTSLVEEIRADWREVSRAGPPTSQLQALQLQAALTRVIGAATTWLRAEPSRLSSDLRSTFSLIGVIKAGTLTQEMRDGIGTPRLVASGDPAGDAPESTWHGDTDSLLTTIDAYQAEWRASQARLESMSADYEREIAHRESVVTDVQVAMQREVDHRERTIHDVQAAMTREIEHREGVIADLQVRLKREPEQRDSTTDDYLAAVQHELQIQTQVIEAIYRSKAWRALSLYWRVRSRFRSVAARVLSHTRARS